VAGPVPVGVDGRPSAAVQGDASAYYAGGANQAIFDGDEVEQAPLGLGDDVRPVTGGEQFPRTSPWLAPRGRVPARAVERDRQAHDVTPVPSSLAS
jgi:hypothetical protein